MKIKKEDFSSVNQRAMGVEFGEWFSRQGDKDMFTKGQLVTVIKQIRKDMCGEKDYPVDQSKLSRLIGFAREYLEVEEHQTIISYKRSGYKLANPKEATTHATYNYKSFVNSAIRTKRKMPLIERKYLPESINAVFKNDKQLLEKFATQNEKFLIGFDNYKKGKTERRGE